MISRIVDIFFSLIGLFILGLILPFIYILIKLDSKGPIFHRCARLGKGGKVFKMYKFRTMYEMPVQLGPDVCPRGDPRVTAVGRLLRRIKLNEFPQFINVLKGDMTLIGPRPEAPRLAAAYPEAARKVFSVKPGLAGPNQILGRNEEEDYPAGVDPVKYYIEHLLPKKLPLDLQFIDDKSIFKDLKYLFLAVKVTLTEVIARRHLLDNLSQICFFLSDAIACLVSFTLAHLLRFDGLGTEMETRVFFTLLPWVVLLRIPIFIKFNFYHTLIRHLSLYDLKRVFIGISFSSLVLVGFAFLSGSMAVKRGYARGVFLIDWIFLLMILIGYRVLLKRFHQWYMGNENGAINKERVLIWGAGDCGELCLYYLLKEPQYEVVGFIDDEGTKLNRRLHGKKILGNRDHLEILKQLYKVTEVFVAIPSASTDELKLILTCCHNVSLRTRFFQPKPLKLSELQVMRNETETVGETVFSSVSFKG